MGYFLEKTIKTKGLKRILYSILGLIIPIFIHAYYNSFLYGGKYSNYFNINYSIIVLISIILYIKLEFKRRCNN